MSSQNDGYATDDPPREEGWKAEEGQGCLQCEACSPPGDTQGEARDRLVTIENSAKEIKPFIVQKVKTAEELIRKICDRFPGMESDALYLRIWSGKPGTFRRQSLKGNLPPDLFDVYVTLYLKKHPSLFVK
jgi:hypothetical protein